MKPILYLASVTLLLAACEHFPARRAAEPTAPPPAAASSPTTAPLDHYQQCSQLRADIASAQHNQRTVAPSTAAPIIAAASEGKEDQRIRALQERYAGLGCAGGMTLESSSPTH